MGRVIWLVLIIDVLWVVNCSDEISITIQNVESTDLAREADPRLIVFSTLSGDLVGVEQDTGNIRWTIKDKAVVKVPKDVPNAIIPLYLPDPMDGSLYLVGDGPDRLKKLPFKIPDLVNSSPCRSTDGILYTGKKKDTWYKLDPKTGERQHILGWDYNHGPTCPVHSADAIYIGRTEYSVMMVDSKSFKKWNVTFYEYTADRIGKKDISNYDLLHFTSSSNGRVVTMDRRRASILWEINLHSPVVAVYLLDHEGFIAVPFTSLSNHTLHTLPMHVANNHMKFYQTLYIGEHTEGLYALRSLVHQSLVTITNADGHPLLLDGPDGSKVPFITPDFPIPGHNYPLPQETPPANFHRVPNHNVIYLGHYDLPEFSLSKLQITGKSSTTTRLITDESIKHVIKESVIQDSRILMLGKLVAYILVFMGILSSILICVKYARKKIENKEDINLNEERIGKIKYDPENILGKGSDGTLVFCGEFEGRKVAIKRLVPECFTFADKEVELLKESDTHPNVVRYFCTEQTRFFKYIALELCQATLADYVQSDFSESISSLNVLQQATNGLAHLHSLNIVHRDIKPQNVLISMPAPDGSVRAMISDFGLCKKLQGGKTSFSRRSGVTGTQGWIAPEILNRDEHTVTRSIDMFSLGCLFYYVLSDGEHPFGDVFQRQTNILNGEYNLDEIKDATWRKEIYKPLIMSLISSLPAARPSCNAVLAYPMFWNNTTILAFLQDVSDRIEKSAPTDIILQKLDMNAKTVLKNDWRNHVDDEVANDLRKYRSYKGDSVRHLLRALRNKKHHFHELSVEAQKKLGKIPSNFTEYWTSRFPLLFIHTWLTMQVLAGEETFKPYYTCRNYCYSTSLVEYEKHAHECDNNCLSTFSMDASRDVAEISPKNTGLYRNLRMQKNEKKRKPKDNSVPLRWVVPSD